MKISIIGSRGYPYVYSGYETFVKELSERLVKYGVDVTVYCHRNLYKERPKKVNGIRLVYIPAIESKIFSQLSNSFLSILHACFSRTDVILVVNSANGPLGILTRLFRKPTAINVDGLEWLRPKWKGLGAKYFFWASRLATRLYDCIINDSDEMRKVYLELFNKESEVIAYGANIRHSKNPELIDKWGLEQRGYYLIVGRLIPDNNADIIVNGFLRSSSTKKLVVVGDVPYKDSYATNIKSQAEKDKRLLFTGYIKDQDELAELYHNSYVYIHGHEFGGTNPTMLKAMAYGAAIIALNTRFNQEMLQQGLFGMYFEKDERGIAELINYCDQQPGRVNHLRENARNGLTQKYQWNEVTKRYIEVFESLKKN